MIDNRHWHRDNQSLLPLSLSSTPAGDCGFSCGHWSKSSPPEFLQLFRATSLAASKQDKNGNGSITDGLFSGGKLLLLSSFLGKARSLDYRRLHGHRKTDHRLTEAVDCGCGTGAESSASRAGPKWYRVLTLGVARVSQKMELEDMRKRQIRRCGGEEEGEEGGGREKRRRIAGWNVMSALSCNGFASVAVDPSIECIPPQPS